MEEVQAYIKYSRMSPKKLRDITRIVQGRGVTDAIDLLKLIPRKSARLVIKAVESAVANAENNNNFSSENLFVHRALIEEGPDFKRFRSGARGMANSYKKRTSHIRIILKEREK